MDLNLTVLAGRLATDAEVRTFESGATLARLLVTVRSDGPRRRIDVVPVVMWDPDMAEVAKWKKGERVWVAGAVRRRFFADDGGGRRSGIEVVAHEVALNKEEVSLDE